MKSGSNKNQGLLMQLLTLEKEWEDLSTDFIVNLPMVKGKSIIIVVEDILSKSCHLGMLPAEFTSKMAASFFVHNIIKLHGIPSSIVSNRDIVFTSGFGENLID